jgi:hypothetical protein
MLVDWYSVDRDERGVMQCHRDEGGVDTLFRGDERGKDLCQLPRFGGFLDRIVFNDYFCKDNLHGAKYFYGVEFF